MDAFTAGERFNASTAAFTKNDMKPKRMLWVFSNLSLYLLRNSMTFFKLISLKVVNMAVFWVTSNRRSAMRARIRVMGTRFSGRPWVPEAFSEDSDLDCDTITFSFVIRP